MFTEDWSRRVPAETGYEWIRHIISNGRVPPFRPKWRHRFENRRFHGGRESITHHSPLSCPLGYRWDRSGEEDPTGDIGMETMLWRDISIDLLLEYEEQRMLVGSTGAFLGEKAIADDSWPSIGEETEEGKSDRWIHFVRLGGDRRWDRWTVEWSDGETSHGRSHSTVWNGLSSSDRATDQFRRSNRRNPQLTRAVGGNHSLKRRNLIDLWCL